ncbi:hypothetical protein [Ferrimonas senticii]|nr:hypothetical protein [Ferrimonas senticii]
MTATSIAFALQIIIGIAVIAFLLHRKRPTSHKLAKKKAAKRKAKRR